MEKKLVWNLNDLEHAWTVNYELGQLQDETLKNNQENQVESPFQQIYKNFPFFASDMSLWI